MMTPSRTASKNNLQEELRRLWTLLIAALVYPYLWAPGAVDPNCTTQDVCQPNYTEKVRPGTNYTNALKEKQILDHGINCKGGCEEDHVIPLELCGSPMDPLNLSPEPYNPKPGAHEKDQIENRLHRELCSGGIELGEAQNRILHWQEELNIPKSKAEIIPGEE